MDVQLLPIRATKSFISYSVEKLDKASPAFQASYQLWNDAFPLILPDLLQFLGYVGHPFYFWGLTSSLDIDNR